MYDFHFKINKKLFPTQVVIKAAYAFIDKCYIHIDESENDWIVQFSLKEQGTSFSNLQREFENEVLSQAVRLSVYQQTHHIREMLMARAMSSSMIMLDEPKSAADDVSRLEEPTDMELDEILTSWFDRYE